MARRAPHRSVPTSASSPGARSFTVAMWRFGTTSTVQRRPRVDVVEERTLVVFVDLDEGISPAIIRQKRQAIDRL